VSTVPAVLVALKALGEATLDTDEWQFVDGPLGTVTASKSRVLLIGDDEIVSDLTYNDLASLGMDDQYRVPLLISVGLSGPDSLIMCRDAALAAFDELRDAVQGLFNLGLHAQGVHKAVVTGERRIRQLTGPEGRTCEVRFYVEVFAQLI
jgi:hypothetical protein